jgi:hypothetical protein
MCESRLGFRQQRMSGRFRGGEESREGSYENHRARIEEITPEKRDQLHALSELLPK